MPPYRPDYAKRSGIGPRLAATEAALRPLAEAWGVTLVGSFDASACGCGPEHFRDDIHPLESCFERFLMGRLPD